MSDWLVEPDHPSLAGAHGDRINKPDYPDRLAWNAYRTLALWDPDVWVPSLLESACGEVNPLSTREWADARVDLWRTGADMVGAVDVTLDGVECFVVVECTTMNDATVEHLGAGVGRALDVAVPDGRQAGFVLVVPETADRLAVNVEELWDLDRLREVVGEREGLSVDALSRAIGWVTWRDVGRLALDLAEESDALRAEQAHQLATELQLTFPGIEL
jgi:hypothetical protein